MPRQLGNPFYVVLLVVGVVFVVTACGYAVLSAREMNPAGAVEATASGAWLMQFLDEHGFQALMVELAVLSVATFAAIATDEYWMRRAASRQSPLDDERDESGRSES